MTLTTAVLGFAAVSVGVAGLGIVLSRSADALGNAFRLDRSITGFLLLAAATSLPELVVSCQVVREGSPEMAVGSLLGSCLMNLLILAVIDLTRRTGGRILTQKAAAHALASLASVLLAATVAVAILLPSMPSVGRFHSASLLIAVVYVVTFRLVYLDRRVSRPKDVSDDEEVPTVSAPTKGWHRPVAWYLGSTLGILLLAPFLASSSIQLSDWLQLSGTFFGAVFLALVTSLPELVTTGEASRMGAEDMAIGNILGSNAFNLLILIGVDFCHPQPLFSTLTNVHAIAALGIVATTTVAAMGLLYRAEKRFLLLEPDAVSVVLMAMLFFYLLYVL
ncbi:MAG: hypothetical protein P8L85_14860 [Rubripirellula sp.]|nr:hypothetical protein [Rubripirellula sp.]